MLQRLRLLLDVHLETEGGSGATRASVVCGSLAARRTRGRDRRKPFRFDADAPTEQPTRRDADLTPAMRRLIG